MGLEICPITFKEANAFVEQHHRHHGKVVGHKFSIGCSDGEKIVGVAIVGRPVSRHLDDGWTLEVNRLCTDGTRNACSLNESGNIFISTYLPERSVANSPDNNRELDPVIYKSTFFFIYKLSTAF